MKHSTYFLFFALLLTITSCTKDICTREVTYTKATANYADLDKFRIPVVSDYSATIIQPSKIFVYENLLFMSEENHGIHIIDNTDPANPENLNFIAIPGNKDLIVVDGQLHADSYYDLLVIDIKDPRNPQLIARNQEVFPSSLRDDQGNYLVGFTYEEVTEKVNCESQLFDAQTHFFDHNEDLIAPSAVPTSFSGAQSKNGAAAGSLSRMASVDNYLYIISQSSIYTLELRGGGNIEQRNITQVGWNIETIYPLNNRLFLGAQNGMHIMDISDRTNPREVGRFDHETSCDPVFPTDEVAYVTLRTGNECQGSINQLDVVSLRNISRPRLIQSIQMTNPHGLTLLNDKLVVCEGPHGIRIFDARDRENLSLLSADDSFTAYDVIPNPNDSGMLLIIGNEGLIQFSIDNENRLSELSTIGF